MPSDQLTDQPAPSRWRLFLDRWNSGAEQGESVFKRFKAAFNAFSLASNRRVNPWLLIALSVALIALVAGITYGAVWLFSTYKVHFVYIYVLLKAGKWILIGVALVGALFLRNWVMRKPAGGGEAEPPPK